MDQGSIESHYTADDLGNIILGALKDMGKDIDALSQADLAPVDEFHIRGREATEELCQLTRLSSDLQVLDVGCGLGGSARFLASEYGCRVTGLDLTEAYCRVASMLSERLGLGDKTEFRHGSALDMPFGDDRFDVVWTEHAQMNIEDKHQFYSEISRVLKPNGRLVFHDIFQGDGGDLHFPVPWADDTSISSLISPDSLRPLLDGLGLCAVEWKDVTKTAMEWFRKATERVRLSGPSPLGLHLLMGRNAGVKFENMTRNLQEGRVAVVQAVLEKGRISGGSN